VLTLGKAPTGGIGSAVELGKVRSDVGPPPVATLFCLIVKRLI
jgi:hypothetical protein